MAKKLIGTDGGGGVRGTGMSGGSGGSRGSGGAFKSLPKSTPKPAPKPAAKPAALGSKARPTSTTGSPKKTVGSVVRNAKTQITNPMSPNTRTGNAARTLKVTKEYMGPKAKGTNPIRRAKATVNTYKQAKKDPTGMSKTIKDINLYNDFGMGR